MDIGSLNQSALANLYFGGYQLVEEKILSSAATSVTFSGLNGDVDEEYMLKARIVNGASGQSVYVRPNGDASNYGTQRLYGSSSSVGANRAVTGGIIRIANDSALGSINFSDTTIYAKSGFVRTAISTGSNDVITTAIGSIDMYGGSWNNIADNITSIVVGSDVSNGLGVGTHLLLFKKTLTGLVATSGMRTGKLNVKGNINCGVMQKIYQNTLAAAATSVTISGLDGNTDVLYELRCRFINNNASASGYYIRPNNDAGANYGYQHLDGSSTTVTAYRGTAYDSILLSWNAVANGHLLQSEIKFYAKSGFIRTGIITTSEDISTTTVTGIMLHGVCWNNTADNITSLVVLASQANGLGIGTVIELFALRRKV